MVKYIYYIYFSWQMYPPPTPGMENMRSQVNVTFWFWLMYPPGMEKLRCQVNVTFWFWLMYPSPSGMEINMKATENN